MEGLLSLLRATLPAASCTMNKMICNACVSSFLLNENVYTHVHLVLWIFFPIGQTVRLSPQVPAAPTHTPTYPFPPSSKHRKWQHILDRSTVYVGLRWVLFVVMLGLYALRVFYINGWFIVTYGLGIYLLNNFIGFLSPQMDPESDGPLLPTNEREEYRPFARRLPEFKFWYQCAKATWVAFGMTFFEFFDVPVYWPILLLYFVSLFVLTMKRQIRHMIKHRYVPWSNSKAKYAGAPGGEKRMTPK